VKYTVDHWMYYLERVAGDGFCNFSVELPIGIVQA
jgi:hypothetical protein